MQKVHHHETRWRKKYAKALPINVMTLTDQRAGSLVGDLSEHSVGTVTKLVRTRKAWSGV